VLDKAISCSNALALLITLAGPIGFFIFPTLPLSGWQGVWVAKLRADDGLTTRRACSEVFWHWFKFIANHFNERSALSNQPVQS
jgi:hypothetical protein